jgi:hypothetical protein
VIEIWIKLDCAIWVNFLGRKLTSKAKAAMQILLQNHSAYNIGMTFLHSLFLPTLHSHPALVTIIPNIIRLKEGAAVPRKFASSVLISMESHERMAGRWNEERKVPDRIVLTSLRIYCSSLETRADVGLIDFFIGDCCGATLSKFWHLRDAYGT